MLTAISRVVIFPGTREYALPRVNSPCVPAPFLLNCPSGTWAASSGPSSRFGHNERPEKQLTGKRTYAKSKKKNRKIMTERIANAMHPSSGSVCPGPDALEMRSDPIDRCPAAPKGHSRKGRNSLENEWLINECKCLPASAFPS